MSRKVDHTVILSLSFCMYCFTKLLLFAGVYGILKYSCNSCSRVQSGWCVCVGVCVCTYGRVGVRWVHRSHAKSGKRDISEN